MSSNEQNQKKTQPPKPYYDSINPYNFIPLSDDVPNRKDVERGGHTGFLECSLKVVTPLIIPGNRLNPDETTGPAEYNFLQVGDKAKIPDGEAKIPDGEAKIPAGEAMIPGSELRGCIRSIYEIITNSCLPIVNDNPISLRALFPNKDCQTGVLEYEAKEKKWYLYPAERWKNKKTSTDDQEPFIERKWPNVNGTETVTKYCYYKKTEQIECSKPEIKHFSQVLDELTEAWKGAAEAAEGKEKRQMEDCAARVSAVKDDFHNKRPVAAFYKTSGKKDAQGLTVFSYFSPAQVSRTVMHRTIKDLLDLQGKHAPCDGKDKQYCPACRLFGTVNGDTAVKSRVRFSDAFPEGDSVKLSENKTLLPILGTPKQTAIEFYTIGPKGSSYWDYDTKNVRLRGRKIYLHGKPQAASGNGTNLQQKVQTATEGSTFRFKVWFDHVTDDELKQLIWALTLGENDPDSRLMHKIGHGRPVGYGSVKITVDKVVERTVIVSDTDVTYNVKETPTPTPGDVSFKQKEDLLYAATYNEKRITAYPVNKYGKIFGWFAENRQRGQFACKLPTLTELKYVQTNKSHGTSNQHSTDAASPAGKKCKECGNNFIPFDPKHTMCKDCYNKKNKESGKSNNSQKSNPSKKTNSGTAQKRK